MSRRTQLHPSGAGFFERCGEAWRRRFIDGEVRAPAAYLIVGRGTDAAVNADLGNKVEHGELLGGQEVEDIACETVEQDFKGDVDLRGEAISKVTAREQAISRTLGFARFAHRNLNPTIRPKAVQRSWSVRLDDFLARRGVKGVKMDYVGTLDVEEWFYDLGPTQEPDPLRTVIRDLKTSTKSPPSDAIDGKHFMQMTSYALGKQVVDGALPARVQVDYLVDLKRGIEHRPVVGTRDSSDLAALFNRIEIIARSLKAGIFTPAPQGSWWCSHKWCPYHSTCPYVRNQQTVDLHVPDQKKHKLVHIAGAHNGIDEGE
jgi:PD-(D/E)XK nuclease superfamily